MNNPYEILGINNDATEEEVAIAYQTAKEKYLEDRFLSGEVGNNAARMLTLIDEAYANLKESFAKQKNVDEVGGKYYEVDSLLKSGQVDSAQKALDKIDERDGAWHYFQSIIFYKKNFYGECKRQLEIAISFEPQNVKYKDSLAKLLNRIANPEPQVAKIVQDKNQMGGGGLCGGNGGVCC